MFVRLARLGTVLAFLVVTVGAWVRLTDAGLGCPDWPGCYGQLVVPELSAPIDHLEDYYQRPLDPSKAWHEMIHRYLASSLGLVCLALAVMAWRNRHDPAQPRKAPIALVGLVVFQGLLGMWTVTLLLKPVIVVGHLLGGLSTLGVLFWLGQWRKPLGVRVPASLRALGVAAVAVLGAQIALGGWTSANYAAIACPDFPTCQTQWWPAVADFEEAFVLWRGLGVNYEGGVLDHAARVAIHFTHRLGALLAAAVLALFAALLLRRPATQGDGALLLAALALQLTLGVSTVLLGVPLALAVAHNAGAAFLLLTVINANKRISG